VSDPAGPELEPASVPHVDALRRRTMILNSEVRHRRRRVYRMPFDPNRPQSGMYDSHGDGHPPRSAYLPAHTRCTASEGPAEGPEDAPAQSEAEPAESAG
jgi:hypothetical protein